MKKLFLLLSFSFIQLLSGQQLGEMSFDASSINNTSILSINQSSPYVQGAYVNSRGCVVCDTLQIRDRFVLNGDTMLVVDRPMLDSMITGGHDVTKACVSHITDLNTAFKNQSSFNQDIGSWDVSNVTDMRQMFYSAQNFNQDIGNWDVGNVTDMRQMFQVAKAFNQDIGSWDVDNVTDMRQMLQTTIKFNQDLSDWCVSKIPTQPYRFAYSSALTSAYLPQWGTCNSPSGISYTSRSCYECDTVAFGTFLGPLNDSVTVVNRTMLDSIIQGGFATKNLCLSKVTDLSFLFHNNASFNDTVSLWDVSNVTTLESMFEGASAFNQSIGNWDVGNVTTVKSMFEGASTFNQPIGNWDVSNVTTVESMFEGASAFNQPIGNWDISNVTSMNSMFNNAVAFNQSLSSWNVSKVTSMDSLFFNASSYNQSVFYWDVSSVTSMDYLFAGASNYDHPIPLWDVSAVTNMDGMFSAASSFSGNLSKWCVSNILTIPPSFAPSLDTLKYPIWGTCPSPYVQGAYVNSRGCVVCDTLQLRDRFVLNGDTMIVVDRPMLDSMITGGHDVTKACVSHITNLNRAFKNQSSFNQDIGSWDVSNVTDMGYMFNRASSFNQDIGNWDVSSVTDMSGMLREVSNFNQDIGNWDVGNVTDMRQMFYSAQNFNQDIGNWDVGNVTDMRQMFQVAKAFNQDIGSWDVDNVTDMRQMLQTTIKFNQDLSDWCVSKIPTQPYRFAYSSALTSTHLPQWGTCNSHRVALSVDMNNYIGGYTSVYVLVNHASSSASTTSMYDYDRDGIWDADILTSSDTFRYRFAIDSTLIPEYLSSQMSCVDTSQSVLSRMLYSSSDTILPTVCFQSCMNCSSSSNTYDITFTLDLSQYDSSYSQVSVLGNFNGWNDTIHPLTSAQGDDIWSITLPLTSDTINYLFALDGGIWVESLDSSFTCAVADTTFYSREFLLTKDTVLSSVCWESCVACPPGPPAGVTFDANGCLECDSLNVGDIFVLNGDSIEVVDRTRLLAIVAAQGDLTKVCVSHVTDMKNILRGATWFDQDISHWDVSNVTNMNSMFFKCSSFNQDISTWNVGNVNNTTGMFTRCDSFNQDLNVWDVSSVTNMNRMFKEAVNFNGAISNWDVENVTRMTEMFSGATSFNQDLSDWCVRAFQYQPPVNFALNSALIASHYPRWGNCPQDFDNVTALATGAFVNANSCVDCSALNIGDYFEIGGDTLLVVDRAMLDSLVLLHDDLSKVCVSNITDMKDALRGLRWFNTDIAYWDVSNVTDMSNMFFKARQFNHDIGNWDVSSVTKMVAMFQVAQAFNQDIGGWDVSNVERFRSMFRNADAFNQNIGGWDVSSVLNEIQMSDMFRSADNFSQDLSMWCVSNVASKPSGFDANSPLTASQLPQWGNCYPPNTPGVFVNSNNCIDCLSLNIGDQFILYGDSMMVVDRPMLDSMITGGYDVTKVCVSHITDMSAAFNNQLTFNQDIGNWDVSNVLDMSRMFSNARNFNQDIGSWDVSNVTEMSEIFAVALNFNQDIGSWDVSNMTDLSWMFVHASSFNQDIGNWDVSNVTDMRGMFNQAFSFNQNLNNWDVSSVTDMSRMFMAWSFGFMSFNGDISGWDVSSVIDFTHMFLYCDSYNQPMGNWDVSSAKNMQGMFAGATAFNQDIGSWNTGQVESMMQMFSSCYSFNQNISNWNVGNVTNMQGMFYGASSFNGYLNNWDVSNVTTMKEMFMNATSFNKNLSSWDVSNVTDMSYMFDGATSFGSFIGIYVTGWDVSSVTNMRGMFRGTSIYPSSSIGIPQWDVSSVTNMDEMFSHTSFNSDISNWCVPLIDSLPVDFNLNGILDTSYYPIWGTCPVPPAAMSSTNLTASTEANEKDSFSSELPVSIRPNPTTGIFYVHPFIEGTYSLIDSKGRTVESGRATPSYDLSSYPNGVYILRLTLETSTHQIRVIKQ